MFAYPHKNAHVFRVSVVLFVVWMQGSVAHGQGSPPTDFTALQKELAILAGDSPGNSVAGLSVIDVATGVEIFAKNADNPMNPASNAKIVTAACALKVLGPEHRFITSIYGKTDGSAVRGALYLKGRGDPTLSTADLWEMGREIKDAGIRRVEGEIVVDDSFFDDQNLPYAFDQQPDEDNKFRAPVGAASLNHNALAITIRPGPGGMEKARVIMDPPGYAVVINDTVTVGQGAHNPKISASAFEDRTKVRVWGQIPLGSSSVTYYRRIDNPSLFTGHGLKGVLEEMGISVGGEVRVGTLAPGTPLLAQHSSPPLSAVLWETGKMSNNFVTEMVLKAMGATVENRPATWDAATTAVAEVLTGWGVPPGSYTYRNGSGLFDANRFSTAQFVKILRGAYMDSSIRPEFVAQLATGGADGTIKSRYRTREALRMVRAKTGTLDDVSALSGYVMTRTGTSPIAFSILVNKAPGYVSAARGYQEKIVTAIAKFLND